MGRRTYAGNAGSTTLSSDITSASTSIAVADATNWPSPSGTTSVAIIARGTASEEKITFSGRSGNTLTGCVRGFDGTAAAAHTAGQTIEHGLSATDIDEVNDHTFDTTNDDHTQYLNTTRHDITGRHTFGAGLGTPTAPPVIPLTGVSATGTGAAPARQDHTHGYNPPACRIYNSASISIPTGALTVLTFDSERYDTDSMHSTSVNTSRITINTAGVYILTGTVSFPANATGFRQTALRLNGGTFIASDVRASIATGIELIIATTWKFAAADYVELLVQQTSGAPLNVTSLSAYSLEFAASWVAVG